MKTSRPGGNGTYREPEEFLSGNLLTHDKTLMEVTCEISKHHKLLLVWDSNMSFKVGGMPSEKHLWFCEFYHVSLVVDTSFERSV